MLFPCQLHLVLEYQLFKRDSGSCVFTSTVMLNVEVPLNEEYSTPLK